MDGQDQVSALQEELRELQSLQDHPGWKRLIRYAAAQKEGRINELLLRPETNEREVHYTRGELAGIKLFTEIPAVEVNRLTAEIEQLQKQIEEDPDVLNDAF